ncbi:MAG: biotin/lipoyl-binding protein, partial [Methylococcales bacterium]|nr:biotin/lipoyl-binding protein [Methylococcales bacterium]
YTVTVEGKNYHVAVGPGDADFDIQPAAAGAEPTIPSTVSSGETITSPMAGNIFKINTTVGATVSEDEITIILEAMKMETEIRTKFSGTISAIHVKEGDAVAVGQVLITL